MVYGYSDKTDKGKTMFKELFAEGKLDYEIYHPSYTSAMQTMENFVMSQGYMLDKEEMADTIGLGPTKPSNGKTNRLSLSLSKNGKLQKKRVHFQVYNRGTKGNEYELNVYIA
jgi:hypothetical protein